MQETAQNLLHRHIEEITPLSDDDFTRITEHFTEKKLRKHQFLVQEGDHVAHEYWVVKGCLKSSYLDADGKEHILQFAQEGWWISDFPAYFRSQAATLTIDCLENVEVLGPLTRKPRSTLQGISPNGTFLSQKAHKRLYCFARARFGNAAFTCKRTLRTIPHTLPRASPTCPQAAYSLVPGCFP